MTNTKSKSKTWVLLVLFAALVTFMYEGYWAFVHDPFAAYDANPELVVYGCSNGDEPGLNLCSIETNGEEQIDYGISAVGLGKISMISNSTIVFDCHDPARTDLVDTNPYDGNYHNNTELCSVSRDGTGFQFVTTNDRADENPSANDLGVITYECALEKDTHSTSICVSDLAGNSQVIFSQEGWSSYLPVIADNGWIAFLCRNDGVTRVCSMQSDGSEFTELPIVLDDILFNFETLRINDHGQIVVNCTEDAFCISNYDGTGYKKIPVKETPFKNLSINNNGQIVLKCHDDQFLLCVYEWDSDHQNPRVLRINAPDTWLISSPVTISDEGTIAFQCRKYREFHTCLIKDDGSGFVVLTKNFGEAHGAVIQE